jgi:hypothetical protein
MLRRRMFASLGLVVGAFAIVFSSSVLPAAAQTNTNGGNALKVSPVRNDLEIKPGATQTIDVYVQNLTAEPAKLKAIINDFVANKDESGAPSIILDENKSAPSRSLKQYVTKIPDFTLQPNENKNIKVTITIPANADAGGYFGAVRFAPASSDTNQTLSLSGSVGSLVLVRVPGDLKEKANIVSLDVRNKDNHANTLYTSNKNLHGAIRIQNTGNVQLQPFGKVQLKKSGKVLGVYEINNVQPRGNVLPDSIRRFDFKLDNLGSFGKYTLDANIGYGSKGELLTTSTTFYIVPVPVMIITAVVLALIIFAIFVLPKMIKKYNQRVIAKATGKKK